MTPDLNFGKKRTKMEQINLENQIGDIINAVKNELYTINAKQKIYSDAFPVNIKRGIASFNTDKKDVKASYYLFAASLTESVLKIENSLSPLSSVMQEADKLFLMNTVILCDSVLSNYADFRKSVSCFMTDSENALASQNASIAYAFNILNEFNRKTKLYLENLNSISL